MVTINLLLNKLYKHLRPQAVIISGPKRANTVIKIPYYLHNELHYVYLPYNRVLIPKQINSDLYYLDSNQSKISINQNGIPCFINAKLLGVDKIYLEDFDTGNTKEFTGDDIPHY